MAIRTAMKAYVGTLATAMALSFYGAASVAQAQAFDPNIRIGVLTNLTLFSDPTGQGSIEAAKMAVEDFLATHPNTKLKPTVISADTQNKPDTASTIARQWFDELKMDLIVDVPNSAVALAVSQLAKTANKVMITTSSGSTRITGDLCSPTTLQWAVNNNALSNAITKALIAEGKKTWYFVTADYAFGHDLESQASESIIARGGKVLGSVRHPVPTSDFSSPLLMAQGSGAQVIGLANSVGDFTNAVRQAAEFQISKNQTVAGFLVSITDVNGLGLQVAQGLRLVTPFYWDANDATRAWTKRFLTRHKNHPTFLQASTYSATLHYLKGVEKAQTHDGKQVVEAMRSITPQDDVYGAGTLRKDGIYIHSMTLYEVKKPSESKAPWDFYKRIYEVPAEEAFAPLALSACPGAKDN